MTREFIRKTIKVEFRNGKVLTVYKYYDVNGYFEGCYSLDFKELIMNYDAFMMKTVLEEKKIYTNRII